MLWIPSREIWTPPARRVERPKRKRPSFPGADELVDAYAMPMGNATVMNGTVLASGPPATNLLAQWKADAGAYHDAGVTLATNGQTVQQWNDQTANALNFSDGSSANRPTFNTNVQNGLPVLTFDGSANSFLKTLTAFDNGTLFVVSKLVSWVSFQYMYQFGLNTNLYEDCFLRTAASSGNATPNINGGNLTTFTATSWFIGCFIQPKGGTAGWRINANTQTTHAASSNQINGICLACDGALGSSPANIQIAEVLLYNAALGTTAETAARNYLNAKWAIF